MTQTQKTFFLVIVAIAVIFLCTLGVWQTERLEWKTNLIKQVELAQKQPFVNINKIASLGDVKPDLYNYRKGRATGVVIQNSAHYLIPRVHEGKSGGHVIQLVRLLPSQKLLLVNRGWFEEDQDFSKFRTVASIQAEGMIKPFLTQGRFQPDNDMDGNEIYWLDKNYFIQKFNMPEQDVLPFVLEQTNKSRFGNLVPHTESFELRNMHYYYACFWFSMAFLLTLFAAYFFYKTGDKKGDD